MEISILTAIFKIIYLIIFMFIFVKPIGMSLFKLIKIKWNSKMKKYHYKNTLRTVYKFLLILIKEYYFNLCKYIVDVFRFIKEYRIFLEEKKILISIIIDIAIFTTLSNLFRFY